MKTINGERNWNGVATTIAALIGLLALIVSAYTAYVERQQVNAQLQQVRAQVWPYLEIGVSDTDHSLGMFNKGVGPAIVRTVQVQVDGKPQSDWRHVFGALGIHLHHYSQSDISHNVLSPGEVVKMLVVPDDSKWKQFRALDDRLTISTCFCSTLGDCWWLRSVGTTPARRSAGKCPTIPAADQFKN
jgi:hypothetical protein